jgi:hypothetical protein
MSVQGRTVRVEVPRLDMYSRPLFLHAVEVILPNVPLELSVRGRQAEIMTAHIADRSLPIDVEGAARAAIKSIGVSGQVRLIAE